MIDLYAVDYVWIATRLVNGEFDRQIVCRDKPSAEALVAQSKVEDEANGQTQYSYTVNEFPIYKMKAI